MPPPALVAAGDAPAWRLWRSGNRWLLGEAGRSVVLADDLGQRIGPHGRVMGARTVDGRVISVTTSHGLCRRYGAGPSAYVVTVRIDRRVLRGCYIGTPPGERPIVD